MDNKKSRFKNACSVLTQDLMSFMLSVPSDIADSAQQICLRVNRPLCIECPNKRYFFTQNKCITDTLSDQPMVTCSQRTLFTVFQNICNYSVYSRQYEINNGFVTLQGGHRAGICGTAVIKEGRISNIKDISSVNIRIARQLEGCADTLKKNVNPMAGVLLCGAPCSGKTTIIRDYARQLSYMYRVSLIDERNELSSAVNGVYYNDIGMCDVFDGYEKSVAINQAVRNMSPDIVICDEISTMDDVYAIKSGVNSGVAFVATMHADSAESLRHRDFARQLLSTNAFSQIVFLDSKNNAGVIKATLSSKSILSSMRYD